MGKTRDVFCALSISQCRDYEFVKERILQAYELVPEAYRQRFRNLVKQDGKTYVEFAREKETAYDRWLLSMRVSDFEKLCQLMLVEEFKSSVKSNQIVFRRTQGNKT